MTKLSLIKKIYLSFLLTSSSIFGYDFLTYPTPDKVVKWYPKNGEYEIKIPFKINPGLPNEFKDSFVETGKKWTAATDDRISFIESDGNGIFVTKEEIPNDGTKAYITPKYEPEGNTLGLYKFKNVRIGFNQTFEFSRNPINTTIYNLDDIMIHEIGHALGLDHSENKESSYPIDNFYDFPTMYGNGLEYFHGGVMKTLHIDDIAGIRDLYNLSPPEQYPLDISINKVKKSNYLYEFEVPDADDKALWKITDEKGHDKIMHGNKIRQKLVKKGQYGIKVQWNGYIGDYIFKIGKLRRTQFERK